ncbi:hypothetical protein L6164_027569 [Bauhinia variegata]|uniref:Uncharacterized protein n=1 Tax=Bauhinia variegata TaxID=167791 RepID=A0ACB9LUK3_BAUVA|nr:hypothetical protein L6164_027569 [Bauhinia variegata]
MGLLQLFLVASFPVIKVLLVTALGLFLALDHINILGEDARKLVNHIVFYVFNPSLVGSNLANTITYESFLLLWFMPVNILGTFVIGSALGWLLIKITRAPKHLKGLILGCCSAGNLGNLPIIIIPSMCKEKGSPFGDPDVCYKYGMAYASLSMAMGAVFLWSYVFNIMRIYSREEANISNDSAKLKESLPEKCSETLDPPNDTMDDAYTLLLPDTGSEEKVQVPLSHKIKHYVRMISSSVNFQAMFAPSTIGALAGFVIGVVTPIRSFLIGSDAPLRVFTESASMIGEAGIPTVTLILGANLLKGLKGTGKLFPTIVGIIAVRYIFLPVLGVLVVKGATHLGLVPSDPLFRFMLLLQYALPPAMNIGTIAQLFGAGQSECSVIMLWTYALASIAMTLWSTYFMWLLS